MFLEDSTFEIMTLENDILYETIHLDILKYSYDYNLVGITFFSSIEEIEPYLFYFPNFKNDGFDISQVKNMNNLFLNTNFENIEFDDFNVVNVYNMSQMFKNCKNLKYINITNFITDKIIDGLENTFDIE